MHNHLQPTLIIYFDLNLFTMTSLDHKITFSPISEYVVWEKIIWHSQELNDSQIPIIYPLLLNPFKVHIKPGFI